MDDTQAFELAEHRFNQGDLSELRRLLKPLIDKNHPGAIRLNASFFEPGTPEEEMNRIHVAGIECAAQLGDLEARYIVGSWYDTGAFGYKIDKARAAHIFEALAHEGHAHATWIYACELLWGSDTFVQNVALGLAQLGLAIERGSADAAITKARLYHEGIFGFEQSVAKRDQWRDIAKEIDAYVYDPYSASDAD